MRVAAKQTGAETGERNRGHGRFVPTGTRVRYEGLAGSQPEYGVVVQCWESEEIGDFDCHVAFFGACLPAGRPNSKPYVRRHAAASLEPIDEHPRRPLWEADPKHSIVERLKSSRVFWVIVALVKVGITAALVVALTQHWSCR